MNVELKTLTSVENEYLTKSGKKRRQKTIIDEINFNKDSNVEVQDKAIMDELNDICKIKNEDEINFTNKTNDIENANNIKSDNSENKGMKDVIHISDKESDEEDYDTLEIIRQLSSIQIEYDSTNNDKEEKAYNKKEKKNIKIRKKKNKKDKGSLIFDITEVECVEDSIIYDESKDTEFPKLQELFSEYNAKFFFNKLDSVEVKWSNKMKLCAGICIFKKSGYCCIRLSLPLLKLRKIKEYRETLLHEMIHAFLFLTRKNSRYDGHGPGVCRTYPPHFGYVKRSMNRPPGPKEKWWRRHSLYCKGNFVKIDKVESNKNKELEGRNKKRNFKVQLENILDKNTNNKKDNDEFEKRADNVDEDMIHDEIIILDSKDDFEEKKSNEDENNIIDLIKNLFNDNKDKILSFPDISIDYHKAFESKKYFEIDSDS